MLYTNAKGNKFVLNVYFIGYRTSTVYSNLYYLPKKSLFGSITSQVIMGDYNTLHFI